MTERTDHQNAFPVDPIKYLITNFEYLSTVKSKIGTYVTKVVFRQRYIGKIFDYEFCVLCLTA